MTERITRRRLLAATTALGLLPAAALTAGGVAAADPAVAAYWRCRASCDAVDNATDHSDEAMRPLNDVAFKAMCDLCQTQATTMERLILQLRAAFYVVGEPTWGQSVDDLHAYEFSAWTEGWEGVLLTNMLATATTMAEVRA